MLHIILFVLKLIGYILFAALCLVLLIFCAVLFVPLKYKAGVLVNNTVDRAGINLNFSWLFHLISGWFSYKDRKAQWHVRIARKRVTSERKEKDEAKASEKSETEPSRAPAKNAEEEKRSKEKKVGAPAQNVEIFKEKKEEPPKKKKSLKEKIQDKAVKICDIIKSLKGKADAVTGFLADDVHKAAFLKLIKEAKVFLIHVKPEKLAGFVCYGLEDPSATGKIYGLISMLYPFLGEKLVVVPDFNEKRIEADLNVSGKFRAVYAAALALKLVADKNIRATIKHIKIIVNKVRN